MSGTNLRSTKVLVRELERAAAFVKAVAGLEEAYRYRSKSGADEIIFRSRDGEAGLILMEHLPAPETPTSNVVLVFTTDDAAAFVERATAAGGKVIVPAHDLEAAGRSLTIALVADPEGNQFEAVQQR